jgi:FixJ family two-component response regulator
VSFAGRLHARERTADIPVVAVTGRPLRDFDGAGFIQVLQKPILPETLIASVRDALEASCELRARSARARERSDSEHARREEHAHPSGPAGPS